MLEGVSGQRGVVVLDVELEIVAGKAVALQERVHVAAVVVVLVLGGLARLGLDEQRALEADLVLVLDHQIHEAAKLVELALHVGVEQSLVAFAPAPQHVVFAAQLLRNVERLLHLRGGVGENLGIGIGCRAGHEARIGKQVGRAPQKLHTRALLMTGEHLDDAVEDVVALGQRLALGRDVAVVEAVVGSAQLLEKFKSRGGLLLGQFDCVAVALPGAPERARAEHVGAVAAEGVPVADRDAQLLFHALAAHDAVLVVEAEGERILRIRTLEWDGLDAGKCWL